MTTINSEVSVKYCKAFEVLRTKVMRNSLEVEKFNREYELPSNFIRACEHLGFLKRLAKGKFVIKLECQCTKLYGKLISIEICNIEKLRKQHFNQLNK